MYDEQLKCLQKAIEGHNFVVYGEARTGKSYFVKVLIRSLKSSERKIQLVCSTGVSCEVYDDSSYSYNVVTLNSFFSLGTAEAPFDIAVEKAVSNSQQRLCNLDTVIWDEHSINSARDLELVAGLLQGNWIIKSLWRYTVYFSGRLAPVNTSKK